MIQPVAAGDHFAAATQQKPLLAAAHLHPGAGATALEGDSSSAWIEPVFIKPGALAAAPGQDPLVPAALELIGIQASRMAVVAGALGVGIGFGLQNIFSNLVSGILILVEKTLNLGDFVDLQSGVVGKVTEIGDEVTLRYRTDRPRTIRLTQGSRSFAWMNLIPLWISLAVLAPLATLMLGSRRGRRWLRVDKNPPRTHPGEANGSGAGA